MWGWGLLVTTDSYQLAPALAEKGFITTIQGCLQENESHWVLGRVLSWKPENQDFSMTLCSFHFVVLSFSTHWFSLLRSTSQTGHPTYTFLPSPTQSQRLTPTLKTVKWTNQELTLSQFRFSKENLCGPTWVACSHGIHWPGCGGRDARHKGGCQGPILWADQAVPRKVALRRDPLSCTMGTFPFGKPSTQLTNTVLPGSTASWRNQCFIWSQGRSLI